VTKDVKKYYEKNSSKFKNFGIDPIGGNIHQPLWGESVNNKREATNYSNQLIHDYIKQYTSTRDTKFSVLDLGCGFGATLKFLSDTLNSNSLIDYTGITISSYQAQQAQKNLNYGASIICDDFQKISEHNKKYNIVYAIESIVHSPDIAELLKGIKKILKEDGVFIIIDDFISSTHNSDANYLIEDYKHNWFTNGITESSQFIRIANSVGFKLIRSVSLSSLIRQSFKGIMGRFIYSLGIRKSSNMYLKSIIGGAARQNALIQGLLDYKMIILSC
jgi:2-polyprenyl-3-methyl-5-hydroxy-6-metoxy-1,4-benzoquinol methylase